MKRRSRTIHRKSFIRKDLRSYTSWRPVFGKGQNMLTDEPRAKNPFVSDDDNRHLQRVLEAEYDLCQLASHGRQQVATRRIRNP